jgi:hypothetical protein
VQEVASRWTRHGQERRKRRATEATYGEGYYCGLEGDVDADAEMAACVEDGCWDSD